MFPHGIRVNTSRIHIDCLCNHILQTGRVYCGSGTDHLIFRQTGQLIDIMCNNVHRIGDRNKNSVKSTFHNRFNNGFCDFCRHLQRIQSRLSLLWRRSGSDHNDIHISALCIGSRFHFHIAVQIFNAVPHVQHLSIRAFLVDIYQHHLVTYSLGYQGKCRSAAHQSTADNCYFSCCYFHTFTCPFNGFSSYDAKKVPSYDSTLANPFSIIESVFSLVKSSLFLHKDNSIREAVFAVLSGNDSS